MDEVSERMPGKFPVVLEEGMRAAALGLLPLTLGGEKKDWECRGLLSGGDRGPSGPLYIWLTSEAAPVYCSLCGLERLVLDERVRFPIGICGAVFGSVCADSL